MTPNDLARTSVERLRLEAEYARAGSAATDIHRVIEDYNRHQDMVSGNAQRILEDYRRQQDLVSSQAERILEDYRRQQDLVSRQSQRIIEDYRRRQDVISSETQRMIEDYRRSLEVVSSETQRMVEGYRRRQDAVSSEAQRIIEDYRRSQDGVSSQTQRMMDNLRLKDSLFARESRSAVDHLERRTVLDSIAHLSRQTRDWARLADYAVLSGASGSRLDFDIFARAQGAWAAGVTSLLEGNLKGGLSTGASAVGSRIMSLSEAYSSFCMGALRDLGRANDKGIADALLGSLNLAEQHFARAAEAIPPMIESQLEPELPNPAIPMRLYLVQGVEISASAGISDPQDVGELVEKSAAARAAARVLDMLRLIPQVNASAKLSGKSEILKPTTRMIEATVDLVALVPSNKSAFADFIDCLYWLFYEAAGRDNLRYLQSNGGPCSEADCDVIWAIKTFRNKWYRHDPDHGDVTGIKRSYRTLGETLRHFGFRQLPVNASDYRRLHLVLVNELIHFLEKLRDALA